MAKQKIRSNDAELAGHRVEERSSPVSMGVQRRIVGPQFAGPWVEGGTAQAWKAYKLARRHN